MALPDLVPLIDEGLGNSAYVRPHPRGSVRLTDWVGQL